MGNIQARNFENIHGKGNIHGREIFVGGKNSWLRYIQVLEIIRSGHGSKGWRAEKEKIENMHLRD